MQSGTYGLSYDVSTRATEDDLPHGWNSRRAETYKQLALCLERGHFARLQKSDWICEDTDAITTYYTMLMLRTIPPPGKFQSTVKGLKMHKIESPCYDISQEIVLGGRYAAALEGPTPSTLVPENVPSAEPLGVLLPRYTRRSEAALNPGNWRV
ncbi:hypothetical protein EDD15DRAFT_2171789 [Pisolithus albus]|nr:hypothetical protein EDD15DRAFT_2177752 [Pisolithus albus]KAI5989152.1 hypothetical protein EDD15DRAFT_2171789 [Pisolithus albus]